MTIPRAINEALRRIAERKPKPGPITPRMLEMELAKKKARRA